jgi:hypothetical protein
MLLGVAFVAAACGTMAARGNRASSTITRQQMIDVGATTLYDAVQKIQPSWFTTRGPRSLTDETPSVASVYVSGSIVGDINYLRNLLPDNVDHMRYWDASEAGARFGMGHPRGVIEVVMRTGRG